MLVVNDQYSSPVADPIAVGIKRVVGDQIKVSFEIVDDIPCTNNGKYPFIVSRVRPK
jgi:hypothetical protein